MPPEVDALVSVLLPPEEVPELEPDPAVPESEPTSVVVEPEPPSELELEPPRLVEPEPPELEPPVPELVPVESIPDASGWAQMPSDSTHEVPLGHWPPAEQSSTHTPAPAKTSSLHRTGAPPLEPQQSQSSKQPRVHTAKLSPSLRHWPCSPHAPGQGS